MAFENAPMNRLAVDLLDVKPDDRVLEIGFGPGAAIALLAERAQRGVVAGVDPSAVMVRQASRRNRKVVQRRVELRQGTAASLPFGDGSSGRIAGSSNFMLPNVGNRTAISCASFHSF
jgi:ubiquinone/menaquinone biosynthesis C-methylase UbiE